MPIDLARLLLSIIAILGLMLLSLWVLSPFFSAITWALMIVVTCWPLMLGLQHRLRGKRSLAVAVMTLAMLLVFIVPLVLAVQTIVENVDVIRDFIRAASDFELGPAPAWLGQLPVIGTPAAELWNSLRDAGLASLVQRAAPYLAKGAQVIAAQAGGFGLLLVHFLLTVVIAAVMFSQGESGAERVLALARRVGGPQGEDAVRLAAGAIRGVALGVVVTALAQTIGTGIGLYIAGVPFAGLLTALILILCIAQLGPGLVLIPAIGWLFWSGATGWGIFLLVWSVPVMTMDNFLRPILIRRGADLPLLLIFAGVLGGLLSMGVVGLFVGPVVLGVTWRLFEVWSGMREAPSAEGATATPPVMAGPPRNDGASTDSPATR
jgi:predicted PurR-regulated permease PerM